VFVGSLLIVATPYAHKKTSHIPVKRDLQKTLLHTNEKRPAKDAYIHMKRDVYKRYNLQEVMWNTNAGITVLYICIIYVL